MELSLELVSAIGSGLLAGGVAWGALHMRVMAVEKEVADTRARLDAEDRALRESLQALGRDLADHKLDTTHRLSSIETKIDTLMSWTSPGPHAHGD